MSDQTSRENTVYLDLPATFKYLSTVSRCLDELLSQEQNIDEQEIVSHDVQLAVQEICTNIIRHAYGENQNHKDERIRATITVRSQPHMLLIELFDKGIEFDQSKVAEPDLDQGQIHGYGLFIVKNLMDEVTYCRQQDCNVWYLTRKL